MTLRLGKLPDRTPRKLTITLTPDLAETLEDYTAIYSETYGGREKTENLVSAMLETFLSTDTGFKRARRALHANQQGD